MLISPHLNPHDLTLLIFPGWIMAYMVQRGGLASWARTLWHWLLFALYLLTPLLFIVVGEAPIGVILDVALLACSMALLVVMLVIPQSNPSV